MRERLGVIVLSAPALLGAAPRVARKGRAYVAAAALVAILGGAVVSSPVAAQDTTATADAEVRIVARELDSGRVEFGLQQRQTDNTWGDRQLPRVRFFPPTATVGRWLVSSPLDLPVGEVRIVARKLDSGRVEFGLQRRRTDNTWGDRRLPRVRFFPPAATVGRWLASSPFTLTAPQAAEGRPEQGVSVESLWVSLDSPAPGAITGTFEVTITFSNAVSGFNEGDIRVANGRTVGLSGLGRTYTAVIEPAADGTVVVRVPADVARDGRGRRNDVSGPLTRLRASRGGAVRQGIDTWDRAGVLDAYLEEFDRAEPDWEYTGDVDNCVAGTTGEQFRDSVFQRLNWYRRMAGLSTVEENEESSAGAQQSALMMLAEGRLSHDPDSAWACYTSTGRSYAGSNLGLGTRVAGLVGIDSYMQDPGEQNTEVGHRRWILYPQTREMGTGNVRRDYRDANGNREANALWPRDSNTFSNRPGVRELRGFVAWPPSGYVPPETAWGRWSFSLGGADFSRASVTMSDDEGPVQVDVIHRSAAPRPNYRSAPEDAIVWAVAGDTDSDPLPAPSGPDHCYTVTVSAVRIGAATQLPYEYSTCVMGEPPTVPPGHPQPAEGDSIDEGRDSVPTAAGPFTAVTAGAGQSCALRSDGTITCWGQDNAGQAHAPAGRFSAVAAGGFHACGLRSDGTIACWGQEDEGQADAPAGRFSAVAAGFVYSCGLRSDGTITCWGQDNAPWADAPAGQFDAVSAGGYHACGLRTNGTITCWGSNEWGQATAPDGQYSAVTAGWRHSCGLRSDGTIACWGKNVDWWDRTYIGQTDAPAGQFSAVAAGFDHSCGLRSDGTIACWGANEHGQADAPAGRFSAITAGGDHSCGLRSDGTIACWGKNTYGQTDAPGGQFSAVAVGVGHWCGLRSDGTIACWGNNYHGQADAPAGQFSAVSAGFWHWCGLRSDATIACWGNNKHGQATAPAGQFLAVSAGGAFLGWSDEGEYLVSGHSCGLRSDGTIACWGANEAGQADAPAGRFSAVAAGGGHSCGLRSDGTIGCWGLNNAGQTDAPAGRFSAVAAGGAHSCGLRSDGTIGCWGWNHYGQTNAPAGRFSAVAAGGGHSCGLRSDGTIGCWGEGLDEVGVYWGQADAPSGQFSAVAASYLNSCGLRADGGITCWGYTSSRSAVL